MLLDFALRPRTFFRNSLSLSVADLFVYCGGQRHPTTISDLWNAQAVSRSLAYAALCVGKFGCAWARKPHSFLLYFEKGTSRRNKVSAPLDNGLTAQPQLTQHPPPTSAPHSPWPALTSPVSLSSSYLFISPSSRQDPRQERGNSQFLIRLHHNFNSRGA